jgi:hypothetical protein
MQAVVIQSVNISRTRVLVKPHGGRILSGFEGGVRRTARTLRGWVPRPAVNPANFLARFRRAAHKSSAVAPATLHAAAGCGGDPAPPSQGGSSAAGETASVINGVREPRIPLTLF